MRKRQPTIDRPWHVAVLVVLFLAGAFVEEFDHCHAAPFVEHLSPPVLCRGKTNRIEITGKELDGALSLWASLPGATLQTKLINNKDAQRAVFDVTVPPDAPLGLYGLRLSTLSGLSNIHIFLVDELPPHVRTATSPGPPINKVKLPALITAVCRAAAVDRYAIDVQAGQRVSFEVVGNRFGKNYDPLVTVRNARGRVMVERDNDVGLFFDCRFGYTFPAAGTYTIEVRDARFQGDPTWHYVLRMGDFPAARVAVPSSATPGTQALLRLPEIPHSRFEVRFPKDQLRGWFFGEVRQTPGGLATWIPLHADDGVTHVESEPNDVSEAATLVTVPTSLCGALQESGDQDLFQFELTKGQVISLRGTARRLGSPADLELVMFHPGGAEARRVDDVVIREGPDSWSLDARFDFTARQDGLHQLRVGDLSGSGGGAFAYRVEVAEGGPKLELKSEAARITLPQGTYQPIPLKVTRTKFAGPITLELRGAPAGITLDPTTIPEDATEFVCQLKADRSAPLSLSTLEIIGRWKSDDPMKPGEVEAVATTHPLIDRRVKDKDLRLISLRDDQIQLPPSLSSRIALSVTPASPFTLELPEAIVSVTKYVDTKFPIRTTRVPGLASPISFSASGGQIGNESEERSNIFVRFPQATAGVPNVNGLVFNRILTRYEKFRVDLSGTVVHENRRVTLIRTFDLDVMAAFAPAPEPTTIELIPGGTTRVRIMANRAAGFTGAVTLTSTPLAGFTHPEVFEIPAGQEHVNIQLKADTDTAPRRYSLRLESRGQVGKYEESVRGPNLSITVKKPPVEKKP